MSTEPDSGHGVGLVFDASQSQRVEVAHSPALNFDEMTIAARVQLTTAVVGSAGDQWVVAEKTGEYKLWVNHSNNRPRFTVTIGGTQVTATGGSAVNVAGGWTHLLGTFDGNAVNLYMDGTLLATTAAGGVIDKATNPLEVGNSGDFTRGWNGGLDDFAMWNRAVAAGEIPGIIATAYGMPTSPPPPPPPSITPGFDFTIPFHSATATVQGQAGMQYTIGGTATMAAGVRQVYIDGNQPGCVAFDDWFCPPGIRGFSLTVTLQLGDNAFTVVAEDRDSNTIQQVIVITLQRSGTSPPPPGGPPPPPDPNAHLKATWFAPLNGAGNSDPGARTYRVLGQIEDASGITYVAIGNTVIYESSLGATFVAVDTTVLIGLGENQFIVTFTNGNGEVGESILLINGLAPQTIGQLGCGEYSVIIKERGGVANLAVLPWESIEWNRVQSDSGTATVVVGSFAGDPKCVPLLRQINPWTHEVAIHRDTVEMWLGPLLKPTYAGSGAQFEAEDMSVWLDVRLLYQDHIYKNATDLSEIAESYFADGIAKENGMRLRIVSSPTGITATRDIAVGQHLQARSEWDSLATSGMPWFALGRVIVVGKSMFATEPVALLTDRHFAGDPEIETDGKYQATVWNVRGSGGGDGTDPVWATARTSKAARLLVERTVDVDTLDADSAAATAKGYRNAYSGEIGVLKSGTLQAEAPMTIDQLLPGQLVQVSLTSSIVPVVGQYRLSAVQGKATSDGKEQIDVTFAQVGVPDLETVSV